MVERGRAVATHAARKEREMSLNYFLEISRSTSGSTVGESTQGRAQEGGCSEILGDMHQTVEPPLMPEPFFTPVSSQH